MNYLLDTNIFISVIRGRERVPQTVIDGSKYVSVVTVGELYTGAYKSEKMKQNVVLIEKIFREYDIGILNLDDTIFKLYAKLRSGLEIRGKRLDDFDLLIAATAIEHDLTLATHNTKHFERIEQISLFHK